MYVVLCDNKTINMPLLTAVDLVVNRLSGTYSNDIDSNFTHCNHWCGVVFTKLGKQGYILLESLFSISLGLAFMEILATLRATVRLNSIDYTMYM